MEQRISIIVPVYRAEAYLPGCLDSILAQTYEDLEIILVDDGSPDASGAICDEYALRDPRVRVIHKTNGGASSARNAGLDGATGRYVCFVDSDDLLPRTSVEALARAVEETGCQYAAGLCGILGTDRVKHRLGRQTVISAQEDPAAFLNYLCTPGSYSPYAKIFDLDIIRSRCLRYHEDHKCSEDSLFIRQYMRSCDRLCLIPEVVYQYNTGNENSLSKKGYPDYCRYFADKLRALEELTEALPLTQPEKQAFLAERAIHGLRVSLRHYFAHWPEKQDRLAFIKLSLEALSPWIGEGTGPFREPSLEKWWSRNRKAALNGDAPTLFRHQRQAERIQDLKRWAKNLLRKQR